MEEKSKEITAISKVLESIERKGQIVTIDAMKTQTVITEMIRKRRADYVLAVEGNQGRLEEDIRLYFEDSQVCANLKKGVGNKKTIEKAHGQSEVREYYQTEDIEWMDLEKAVERPEKHGYREKDHTKGECWYYIMDVTFRKDANTTFG